MTAASVVQAVTYVATWLALAGVLVAGARMCFAPTCTDRPLARRVMLGSVALAMASLIAEAVL